MSEIIRAVILFTELMKRHILLCGLVGGILITLLKWTEYRFLVIEHSIQIYGGLTAAVFAVLGIWLGRKLAATTPPAIAANETVKAAVKEVLVPAAELRVSNESKREEFGITRRELEILELIAQGLSNREIAEKLYVSENTVKTHCSRTFDKLGAKRRTQAVQLGKELGLLP
jgi:NarL family two-component system response regulator LiaR